MTDEYKVLDHGCRWTVLGPGETKTLSEWSLSIGGHRSVIYNRYRRGVRGDKLLEPVRVYRKAA